MIPSAHAPSAASASLPTPTDDCGDLLLCGLWSSATDCILDVRIADTEAKTYQAKDPMKVLASHEKNKKKNYLAPCHAQWCHFTLFIVSADGLLGCKLMLWFVS